MSILKFVQNILDWYILLVIIYMLSTPFIHHIFMGIMAREWLLYKKNKITRRRVGIMLEIGYFIYSHILFVRSNNAIKLLLFNIVVIFLAAILEQTIRYNS